MTVINNSIYKLKEEIGLDAMLFNWFEASGYSHKHQLHQEKTYLCPSEEGNLRLSIIKTAAFRFERLGISTESF